MLNIYVKTRYLQNKPYSWTGNMNLTATLILENIVFLLYKEEIPEHNKINPQTRCPARRRKQVRSNLPSPKIYPRYSGKY